MGARDERGEPEGMPWEFYRWLFAERYGWTLAQVDELSMGDITDWFQIEDARAKAREVHNRANVRR